MKSRNNKTTLILPPPTAGGRDELAPFLKAKDLPKKGSTKLTLLGEGHKSSSQFGEGIDVVCKIGIKQYILTIRFDSPDHRSPNYRHLFERFGDDIRKWKGTVKVARKKHMGHEYVAVMD